MDERNTDASSTTIISDTESAAATTPADSAQVSDLAAQLEALTAERDQLVREKTELQDRLLRRQAEFDNFRKRVEREKLEMSEYMGMETARILLPILDDFERALKVESQDAEYAKGMELIYQRMRETLIKAGLEPFDSAGQPFDPYLHHALDRVSTEEAPEDSVLEEYQRGYNFKGKLLRPAMVRVAVRP